MATIYSYEGNDTVEQALQTARSLLKTFVASEGFLEKLKLIFGASFDLDLVGPLVEDWVAGGFSTLPKLEIRSAAEINGANGAFASSANTVYLSREFLDLNADNPGAVTNVLLEEIGHYVDWRINFSDAAGDEGAIFSTLLQGQVLSQHQLNLLQAEDDTATIALDGQVVQIEQAAYTGTNLEDVIAGMEGLLDTLQDAVESQVFGNQLPVLGDTLKNSTDTAVQFLQDFKDDILNKLHEKLDGVANKTPALIQQALFEALGPSGLGLLQDLNGDRTVNAKDISFAVAASGDDVEFNLKLSKSAATATFNTAMDADIGLPGLGLTIDGSAEAGIGYDLNLRFGVNKTNGFYLDTATTDELKVNLNTALPDLLASGKLGFLQINATDRSSQFNGNFSVDLKDLDGQLQLSELPSVNFDNLIDTKLSGAANVKLNFATSFNGSAVLPSISSDFNLDWSFSNANVDPNQSQSFGSTPTVAFNNVKLDLASFFNDFTRPVLDKVQKVTEPIKPIIDILTRPIDLKVAKFNLLDIAERLKKIDQKDRDFIESAAQLISVVNSVPTGSSLSINLGNFNLGTADVRTPGFNLSSINPKITVTAPSLNSQLSSGSEEANFIASLNSIPGKGLQFPILNNPTTAFNLLLGKDADLFTYDMPELSFLFDYSQFFPVIGPLGAEIKGQVGAGVKLGFGFDTAGLRQFNNTNNSADVFNGFFVSDPASPEVTLSAGLEAFAALNAGVASAGVGGGIFGKIGFDLNDPNNDAKARFGEFAQLLDNPLNLFDTSGELAAGLSAYLKLGIDPLSYTERFESSRVTLLDFNRGGNAPKPQISLATGLGSGVLRLNMGPNAAARQTVNTTDGAEVFTVEHESGLGSNETVLVSAFGATQQHKKVGKIVANAGEGKDTIEFEANVLTPADLTGGNGDDLLISGSGNDKLIGGSG